jgi:drug/metabolite transporter (DMT)-like permease
MFSGFWALQIFAAKLAFNAGVEVLSFQLLSYSVVLIILVVVLLGKVAGQLFDLFRNQKSLFWQLFGANSIQAGLGTFLSMIGIAMTAAINAGFLVKLTTVTTILFAWVILNERMTPLKLVTVFIMMFGAYLLTTKGQVLLPRAGDLFILGACFCWSLGSVLIRRILKSQPVNPDVVTMQKPIAGLLVLLILVGVIAVYTDLSGSQAVVFSCCTVSPFYLPYAAVMGICLAGAWFYLNRTLKVATASYMTLMSMVTPVLVGILALSFLGETLVWVQVVGAVLIILSGTAISFSDIAAA